MNRIIVLDAGVLGMVTNPKASPIETYPRIKSVRPLDNYHLLVDFTNDVAKIYDCTDILRESAFALLRNKAAFHAVQLDRGGYGISWNDDIDLSEAELWKYGKTVEDNERKEK